MSPGQQRPSPNRKAQSKDDLFLIVACVALIAGIAVAVGVCGLWKYHPAALSGGMHTLALMACPPFLLAAVSEATSEDTLPTVMTIGTIIFANGFLYAGVTSLAYFFFRTFQRRQT